MRRFRNLHRQRPSIHAHGHRQDLQPAAALAETEPNNEQAQKISLPCDIAGNFFPAADVDRFEFTATKGDVWWVEVASERLGRPTDPAVLVQHVSGEGADEKLTDVVEFTDIASPMKPSSNGYAYDGPPYDGGSADIIGKLEIKEDGVHRLQLTDLFGGTRNDAQRVSSGDAQGGTRFCSRGVGSAYGTPQR